MKFYLLLLLCSALPASRCQTRSESNAEWITATSDTADSTEAVLTTESACFSELTSFTGTFTSPYFPNYYGYFVRCAWRITSQSSYVFLDFQSFDTEQFYDYVTLYDGYDEFSSTIASLSGYYYPPPSGYRSWNRYMYVTFNTYGFSNRQGFSALYSSNPIFQASSEYVTDVTGYSVPSYTCFQEFYSFTGTFASPNFPNYYDNYVRCAWRIYSQWSYVFLDFQFFDTEQYHDYVTLYDGYYEFSSVISSLSGYYNPPPTGYRTWNRYMFITFNTDGSITRQGFSAIYSSNYIAYTTEGYSQPTTDGGYYCGLSDLYNSTGSLQSPNYPGYYPNNVYCTWRITSTSEVVVLDFDYFSVEYGYDYVILYDSYYESNQLAYLTGYYNPPPRGFYSSQRYMYIVFNSDSHNSVQGFYATYRSSVRQQTTAVQPEATTGTVDRGACSPFSRPLVLTGFAGTFVSPNHPSFYNDNADCQWMIVSNTITGIVRLDFNSLSTEECCDFVILYDGSTTKFPRIATLSGTYSPPPEGFNSTQRYLYVQLLTDYSDTSSGFSATYTSIARDACSPNFRPADFIGNNGSFTSANYPGNYFNDADCQWRITAVDPKWIVQVVFYDFSTESCCDEVILYDGDSIKSDRITSLHGWYSTPLGPFRSTDKYMFIRFTSDSSGTSSGFYAEYTSTYVPDPCSADSRPANLTGDTGFLLSPNFPTDYNNDGDCQWLIAAVEPDGFVKLEVTFFSTESCCDTLILYDGDSIKSPRLASLSGSYSTLPLTYISTLNYMFVRFTTDSSGTAAGFNATYTSVAVPVTECGSILNVSPNGTAIIPGWGPSCYITPSDTAYVNTPCRDLIQKLPPNIGNYTNLLALGGNFGCGTSIRNDFVGSDFVCLDNYQQTLTLASQPAATKLVVCIRLPTNLKAQSKRSLPKT